MCSGPAADLQTGADTLPKEVADCAIDANRIADRQPVPRPVAKETLLVPVSDRVVCRRHCTLLPAEVGKRMMARRFFHPPVPGSARFRVDPLVPPGTRCGGLTSRHS